MIGHVDALLSRSSDPICTIYHDIGQMQAVLSRWGTPGEELCDLLHRRNGFWAFESSFLLRPFDHTAPPLGVLQWNECQLWKRDYSIDLADVLCFAEDIFGTQYCLRNQAVALFDPETAEFEDVAPTVDDWAKLLIEDFEYRTGFPVAHEWQMRYEPIAAGCRLLPKIPFVLGGRFEVDNLYASKDVDGMIGRAMIANQILDLPDGSEVVLEVVDNAQASGKSGMATEGGDREHHLGRANGGQTNGRTNGDRRTNGDGSNY